eukprot:45035-Eustigmatos_ZCMA.PRE.1
MHDVFVATGAGKAVSPQALQRASVGVTASSQSSTSPAGSARQSMRTSALPASARLRPSVRDEDEDVETESAGSESDYVRHGVR